MNTGSAAITRRPHTRARRRALAVAASVAAVLAIIAAFLVSPRAEEGAPPATPTAVPTEAAPGFTRPSGWEPHRPAVHLTPERHWMNDPQRPFLLDGVWHYYYLYNADYPEGNGTAWYHATSTDLVHWQDHGVAIEKYTNGLGDIWTGTAVVDHENTAGFGEDAVIAMVTQQSDGVQRQSLFVSLDGGYSFDPYDGNPVIDNPGVKDFRDPRLVWDEARRVWIMALAEGEKIGLYTSPDLKDWTYRSGFTAPGLGVLECPDLFQMAVDGDPTNVRWVLAAGANGAAEGMTTGTVYWVGDWDGETFTPDSDQAQWLDRGSDFYAAVTWDDPRLPEEERLGERYGIGWLNNWAYAGDLPTEEWHGGSDSIVRSHPARERRRGPRHWSPPRSMRWRARGRVPRRGSPRPWLPAKNSSSPSRGRMPTASGRAPRRRAGRRRTAAAAPAGRGGRLHDGRLRLRHRDRLRRAGCRRHRRRHARRLPGRPHCVRRRARRGRAARHHRRRRLGRGVRQRRRRQHEHDQPGLRRRGSGLRAAASRGPVQIESATVTPLRVAAVQRAGTV